MGGKTFKKIGKAVGGEALGAAAGLPVGVGAAVSRSKFGQTTWNRLNGDGGKKGGSSAKAVTGTPSGDGEGGGSSGSGGVLGSDVDAVDAAEAERRKRMQGTLIGNGPTTFGYGPGRTETVGG